MKELLKRAEDLKHRGEQRAIVTHTGFLTPAEAYELRHAFPDACFSGGGED